MNENSMYHCIGGDDQMCNAIPYLLHLRHLILPQMKPSANWSRRHQSEKHSIQCLLIESWGLLSILLERESGRATPGKTGKGGPERRKGWDMAARGRATQTSPNSCSRGPSWSRGATGLSPLPSGQVCHIQRNNEDQRGAPSREPKVALPRDWQPQAGCALRATQPQVRYIF